jgi:Ser/Thr protein kinase RdoA (MazF antagonist)
MNRTQQHIEKDVTDRRDSIVKISETKESQDDIQFALEALGYNGEDLEDDDDLEVAFLDDDGPSIDIPTHICTTNIIELYGWKPGESLEEAMKRKAKGK